MAHVGAGRLVHEGRVIAVGFGQTDLVRYVGVYPLHGGRLGREGRVVLLHHFLLHAHPLLLLIPLLVSNHLQIFDLGLGSRRQALLHSFARAFDGRLELLSLALVFYDVGLAH